MYDTSEKTLVVGAEGNRRGVERTHDPITGSAMSVVLRDYETRAGAERMSEAEEFEHAIIDLARIIVITAIKTESSALYAPVLGHLVKARRALREAFGKAD